MIPFYPPRASLPAWPVRTSVLRFVRLCATRLRVFVLLFIFLQGLQLQPIVNIFFLGRKHTGLLLPACALPLLCASSPRAARPSSISGALLPPAVPILSTGWGPPWALPLPCAPFWARPHPLPHLFSRLGLLALHWTAHRLFYRLLRNGFARLFHRRGLGALRSGLLIGPQQKGHSPPPAARATGGLPAKFLPRKSSWGVLVLLSIPLPPVSLGHNSTALARHLITDHTARNRGVQRVYFSLHGQGYDKITTFFDQAADAESLRTDHQSGRPFVIHRCTSPARPYPRRRSKPRAA